MQVATYTQQESSLSLAMRGLSSLQSAVKQAAFNEEGELVSQSFYQQASTDLVDIQQGLMQQMQNAAQDMTEIATDSDLTLAEKMALFEEEVNELFTSLFEEMMTMLSSGNMAGMADAIAGTKDAYFALELSLSVEISITTVQEVQPVVPNMTLQALSTVAQAEISRQDKETLISLIAMIDEFVKTPAHDHLMNSVIAIVPLIEQTTSARDAANSAMSIYQALDSYMNERLTMRQEAQPYNRGYQAPGSEYGIGGYHSSFSMSYHSQQSVSFFAADA